MQSDLSKRLLWSGLTAGLGALAAVATRKVAVVIWKNMFGEEPPE